MRREADAVLPADVDDPALVSGGNVYDRRALAGLRDRGWTVREHPVAGTWPRPGADARAALAAVLHDTHGRVLIDGLVACGAPDVVVPHGRRLAVLVHLPLGEEARASDAETLCRGEGAVLRAAGAVVVTSRWAAGRVVAGHGLDPARVHVAEPGVDPVPPAAGTDGAHRLLCLGAITPTKGQDLLVEALSTLTAHPWHCDLVGPTRRDPAHVAAVTQRIAHHGLHHRITLAGPRTVTEKDATLNATDLLVVPSRVETYGMAAAEALARGIPVLATDVGGLSDTLGGVGFLIPAENVAALGAALCRWLTDETHRAGLRLSANSRAGSLPVWTHTSDRLARALATLP